jgi:hypothetical protein
MPENADGGGKRVSFLRKEICIKPEGFFAKRPNTPLLAAYPKRGGGRKGGELLRKKIPPRIRRRLPIWIGRCGAHVINMSKKVCSQ